MSGDFASCFPDYGDLSMSLEDLLFSYVILSFWMLSLPCLGNLKLLLLFSDSWLEYIGNV
jgi:hypothetical protein